MHSVSGKTCVKQFFLQNRFQSASKTVKLPTKGITRRSDYFLVLQVKRHGNIIETDTTVDLLSSIWVILKADFLLHSKIIFVLCVSMDVNEWRTRTRNIKF